MIAILLFVLGAGLIAIGAIVDRNEFWRYLVVVGLVALGMKVLDLAFNLLYH